MRRLLLFACALFGFMACTQNPIEEQSVIRTDAPETLRVGFEDDETRIQLNEAQKTVWTKDDLVSVFYRSDANQKWQYQGESGERVGDLKRVENATSTTKTTKTVVIYPYSESYWLNTDSYAIDATLPATQYYAEGSYGVGSNLMVSQSEFTQFSLKSVCGWLKLQLTGDGAVVKSIKFRGNDGEQVAGLIYVDTATAEATLASEMGSSEDNNAGGNLVFDDTILTEVVLDCGEGVELGAEATPFYISLPPQTFANGFTVEIECEDYELMTLTTEKELVIERNHIQPMAATEFVASVPNNQIWYTSSDGNIVEPENPDAFGSNITSNKYNNGMGVITFDGDVTTIGDSAFQYCHSLTSITIPDSVTAIGDAAFEYCSSLTSVTIPESVTSIGNLAFIGCNSLTSVNIGDSVTEIGNYAFAICINLQEFTGKFAEDNGRILVVDGVLTAFAPAGITEYNIPDSVTTIGHGAFFGCDSLTSVNIPDSVTEIGIQTFACCSLTSVNIPDSVTTIGDYAFEDCRSLTSVTIPDSVTTIGECAFASCISLTSVTIPDSVTEIGNSAFYGCRNLTSVTIPESVTTIGSYAFSGCSSLTSVTIPESVTTIGSYAFYDCSSLTSVTIPESVTTIGDYAFYDCVHLTNITIPDSVTTIGDWAFAYCYDLTSVTIGNSVTSIGDSAFYYCTGELIIYNKIIETDYSSDNRPTNGGWLNCAEFTKLTIGDGIEKIGDYAFYNCNSLKSVTIPDSVTTIGEWAFYNCSSLTSVYISDIAAWCNILFGDFYSSNPLCYAGNLYLNNKLVTDLTIPNSVTTIGDYAFADCNSIKSVTIPNSVTTIGYGVFSGCSSLTSVTIPDSVTTIGDAAFSSCYSLTSVTIPDSVTTIGEGAFAFCGSLQEFNGKFASEDGRCLIIDGTLNSFAPAGLTEYTIPNSVTMIEDYAFADCNSLTSVTIPDSVTSIGYAAFSWCESLTSVTIPDSVTSIGGGAFRFCSSLTSVTIPDSVTEIGDEAFSWCESLTSVYCKATTPPVVTLDSYGYWYAFNGNASGRKIYVPMESVNKYKSASGWSEYKSYIVGYNF